MKKDKTGVGIIFIIVGFLLGLIAGLLLYGPETEERETFVYGCKVGIGLEFIALLIATPIVLAAVC